MGMQQKDITMSLNPRMYSKLKDYELTESDKLKLFVESKGWRFNFLHPETKRAFYKEYWQNKILKTTKDLKRRHHGRHTRSI